jgi:hypothetical protein
MFLVVRIKILLASADTGDQFSLEGTRPPAVCMSTFAPMHVLEGQLEYRGKVEPP